MARKPAKKVRDRKESKVSTSKSARIMAIAGLNANYVSIVVIVIFIFVFGLISITSFLKKSPTVDEPVHLLSGYSYLKWGDFRANPEHPPLAKMVAALPLLLLEIKDPRPSTSAWNAIPAQGPDALDTVDVASRMLFVDNDGDTLFFFGKLMMIAVAMVLGIFVFKWSRELFGLGAAVVSLVIYALDPNILAHSQLIHTDLPFAACFFIGSYYFSRSLNQLNPRNLFLTVLCFALAAVTKYSYAVMFLAWVILAAIKIFSSQPQELCIKTSRMISSRWQKTLVVGSILSCALIGAYVLVWAIYGFRFAAIPGGAVGLPLADEIPQSAPLRALFTFIAQHRWFPEAWIYGQLHAFGILGRDTYLFGEISIGKGFWLYFPTAFAVKTPAPTLFLLAATVALWLMGRVPWRQSVVLLVPAIVYFALAVVSGINIGLRHIISIYPFIFVLLGGTAVWLWNSRKTIQRRALAIGGAWYVLSCLYVYPNYLSFFSELAGGAGNGHKILLDSNLDWGQDLKGLKRWLVENQTDKIQFLYFGVYSAAAPRYYGINADFLPGSWVDTTDLVRANSPFPNTLAISVNHIFGYFQRVGDAEFVKAFRNLEPIATIGNSIWIYKMDRAIEQYRRLAQRNPDSAETHYDLANLLSHHGDLREAVEQYQQALAINPTLAVAHNRLAMTLLKAGQAEEAIKHWQAALKLGPLPNRIESQFYLGMALAKLGRLAEAEHYLNIVLLARPKFAQVRHSLGVVSAAQGNLRGAIEHFHAALSIEPRNTEILVAMSRALMEAGMKDEAIQYYQEAIRLLRLQAKRTTAG